MSVKLREMLDKRNTAVTQARTLVDKADTEKRSMTDDEKRQYDGYMTDAVTLRENIDREQKLIDEEKRSAEEGLRLAEMGDDKESIRAFGADVVTDLCQTLLDNDVPGLHFYTLNNAEATLAIWRGLFDS